MTNLDLRIDRQETPLGLESCPDLSWVIHSDLTNVVQTAYELNIASGSETVYESGKVSSSASVWIRPSFPLSPFTEYKVSVTVWIHGESDGETVEEEATAKGFFETGRLSMPWQACWISGKADIDNDSTIPPYLFKKSLTIPRKPAKARLFASALGLYHITVDGNPVSEDYFEPGYTQYNKRIPYKEYDVTALFSEGEHTIYTELAGGWYTGRLGLTSAVNLYGNKRAFLMELRLFYDDGTSEVIATDGTWLATEDGPRRFAGFFDGEIYDARKEDEADLLWYPVMLVDRPGAALTPYDGSPVCLHERKKPVSVWTAANGKVLCDFGKNFAGIVGFENLKLSERRTITVKHGEILDNSGNLYTGNLRTAKAQLVYHGKIGTQSYLPRFTYMGFRFAEVDGLSENEVRDCFFAYELWADMPETGSFTCSDERINTLQRNIQTGQKANFVEIPTDCPQRDERCGWTGDIAMFAPTAAFNMDISLFMRKWLRDVRLAQTEKGVVPDIVPTNNITSFRKHGFYGLALKKGAAGWGDVITLAPWTMYQATGDISFLEENFDAMRSWVDYIAKESATLSLGDDRYIWSSIFQFGDWLAPGVDDLKCIARGKWTATAFFAHSAHITAQAAELLGRPQAAKKYAELYERVRSAFQKKFLDKNGHIEKGFQTIYVLALQFGLLEEREAGIALSDLCADIAAHGGHLATGFPGTPFINYALSDHGKQKEAFDLLFQDTVPSWLYPIKCGATSIWERWDALREDGTVNESSMGGDNMVSFNHYAYGAVGNWLDQRVGGLEMTEPGYRSFRVRPLIDARLTEANVTHTSPYGEIESSWKADNGRFTLCVTVPCNTTAAVALPDGTEKTVGSGKWTFDCAV